MLETHSEVKIVGEAEDDEQALAMFVNVSPDLNFLDVQMAEVGGSAVPEKFGENQPVVIFVTA